MSSRGCDTLTSLDAPLALSRYVLPFHLYVLPRTGNSSDVASAEGRASDTSPKNLLFALEEGSTSIGLGRATSADARSLLSPPASENLPPRPAPELFTARHLKHASFEAKTLAPHLGHSQSFWCMLADDKTKPKWLRTLLWLLSLLW